MVTAQLDSDTVSVPRFEVVAGSVTRVDLIGTKIVYAPRSLRFRQFPRLASITSRFERQ